MPGNPSAQQSHPLPLPLPPSGSSSSFTAIPSYGGNSTSAYAGGNGGSSVGVAGPSVPVYGPYPLQAPNHIASALSGTAPQVTGSMLTGIQGAGTQASHVGIASATGGSVTSALPAVGSNGAMPIQAAMVNTTGTTNPQVAAIPSAVGSNTSGSTQAPNPPVSSVPVPTPSTTTNPSASSTNPNPNTGLFWLSQDQLANPYAPVKTPSGPSVPQAPGPGYTTKLAHMTRDLRKPDHLTEPLTSPANEYQVNVVVIGEDWDQFVGLAEERGGTYVGTKGMNMAVLMVLARRDIKSIHLGEKELKALYPGESRKHSTSPMWTTSLDRLSLTPEMERMIKAKEESLQLRADARLCLDDVVRLVPLGTYATKQWPLSPSQEMDIRKAPYDFLDGRTGSDRFTASYGDARRFAYSWARTFEARESVYDFSRIYLQHRVSLEILENLFFGYDGFLWEAEEETAGDGLEEKDVTIQKVIEALNTIGEAVMVDAGTVGAQIQEAVRNATYFDQEQQ